MIMKIKDSEKIDKEVEMLGYGIKTKIESFDEYVNTPFFHKYYRELCINRHYYNCLTSFTRKYYEDNIDKNKHPNQRSYHEFLIDFYIERLLNVVENESEESVVIYAIKRLLLFVVEEGISLHYIIRKFYGER